MCIAACDRYHIRSPSSWIGKALCVRPAWDADTDTCQNFQPQCNCLPYLKKGERGQVWLVADGYRYNMQQVPSLKPPTYMTDSLNKDWYTRYSIYLGRSPISYIYLGRSPISYSHAPVSRTKVHAPLLSGLLQPCSLPTFRITRVIPRHHVLLIFTEVYVRAPVSRSMNCSRRI